MTATRTLRQVVELQAAAFDDMRAALGHTDYETAAHCAAVVSACALIRIAGTPEPRRGRPDPLDHDDPYESEAEYVERERRQARD